MKIEDSVLRNDEKAVFELRSLYSKYGYSRYRMSKFEEYDLYVRNKDFLISDNIITFTDTDGKLMALKPDVTLSIIKNSKNGADVEKLYYNENVYRVSKGSHAFKEIMQVGLECIGNSDDYSLYEVIYLAAMSLKTISENFVLDVSNLAVISDILLNMGVSEEAEKEILKCIGEKNAHGIAEICKKENVSGDALCRLVSLYGEPSKVIPELYELLPEETEALKKLKEITFALEDAGLKGKINIDFSVINDMNYYNGFVFRGFIEGIATGILSGGQYDKLMQKMGKKQEAVGFAVYLDSLYALSENNAEYDVDDVILYDDDCDIKSVSDTVKLFTQDGKSVTALKTVPSELRYKRLLKMNERGVEIIENRA